MTTRRQILFGKPGMYEAHVRGVQPGEDFDTVWAELQSQDFQVVEITDQTPQAEVDAAAEAFVAQPHRVIVEFDRYSLWTVEPDGSVGTKVMAITGPSCYSDAWLVFHSQGWSMEPMPGAHFYGGVDDCLRCMYCECLPGSPESYQSCSG